MIIRKQFAALCALSLAAMCIASAPRTGADEIPRKYARAIEKQISKMDKLNAAGPYKPDWKDLEKHEAAPEWFRDAKFGIYWHWGVYSVPAYGNEWYPKWMHVKNKRYYKHHVKTYGQPDEFGYHDFVPMFKAEKFDADEWAELCKKAGARYAGPVVEHHDGFSMWDSDITPWNAADMGPKKDLTGLLEKAIRKRGMKFVTTFHHERTKWWYPRVEGWPTTTEDPVLRMLYANVSNETYYKIFIAKLGEVIDKYQPDLIWHDGALGHINKSYSARYLAYYFNSAKKWGRDVVVTTKNWQYPREISVLDFEKGRADKLTDYAWLTDDTISRGSWCYTKGLRIKDTRRVLHDFIDIVSKNGCLLLNISPKANGMIPDDQKKVLLEMGAWLDVNGEAIYNTRPWEIYGEGTARMKKGGHFVGEVKYTGKDVRYTRSKDGESLYAIVMGWLQGDKFTLRSAVVSGEGKVAMLGYEKPLTYTITDEKHLLINVPELSQDQRPCEHAYVFKISGFDIGVRPGFDPDKPLPKAVSKDLTLGAGEAALAGSLRLEDKYQDQNIGYWNSGKDKVVWKVAVKEKDSYKISASYASPNSTRLVVEIAEQNAESDLSETGGFGNRQTASIGQVKIAAPGTYEVVAKPASPKKWNTINLWNLELNKVD